MTPTQPTHPNEKPASPTQGELAVKALNWKFFDVKHDHGRGDWDANHAYGTFTIHDCGDKFGAENRFYVPHLSTQFATIEAAQSAVFEQYSQRILSALDRTTLPTTEDMVLDRIIEKCRTVISERDDHEVRGQGVISGLLYAIQFIEEERAPQGKRS